MGFKMRKTTYVDVDIDRSKLMTLTEAAEMIGITLPGVIRAIERGSFTEIIDEDAGYHNRRLLIRDEVEEFKKRHEKD
ncbi:MAG: hypothetical protein P8Z00_19825 [Anaerolineales bacterium]|jgi:hypothetical protein